MSNIVLLTGGAGFTGYYVKKALVDSGFNVFSLTTRIPSLPNEVQGDLMDIKSLNTVIQKVQPDYVIHLAAIAFVGHANESSFYSTNVIGSINLLNAIYNFRPNIKKIILSSSANIYGNPEENPVSESLTPKPINHYAMSKLSMEILAENMFKDKLPLLMVRPFNYTGKGQSKDFIIPKIVDHFKNKSSKIELGNVDVIREFNDVRDIANLYVSLLMSEKKSGIFNFCSGTGYGLGSVLEICEKITDHKVDVVINPLFIRKNELKILTGSNDKIREVISNYEFYTLEETLKWMLSD